MLSAGAFNWVRDGTNQTRTHALPTRARIMGWGCAILRYIVVPMQRVAMATQPASLGATGPWTPQVSILIDNLDFIGMGGSAAGGEASDQVLVCPGCKAQRLTLGREWMQFLLQSATSFYLFGNMVLIHLDADTVARRDDRIDF